MDDSNAIRFPFQEAFEHFWINPQTNWERFFNPQIFVSYNRGDAGIENHVLARAGSYGKQLGQILDVLDVLVARVSAETLTPRERLALDQFRDLSRRVDTAVAEYQGTETAAPPTLADVDRLLESLGALEHSDPAAYRLLVDRLRRGVNSDARPG
jgi:hypothetical protein